MPRFRCARCSAPVPTLAGGRPTACLHCGERSAVPDVSPPSSADGFMNAPELPGLAPEGESGAKGTVPGRLDFLQDLVNDEAVKQTAREVRRATPPAGTSVVPFLVALAVLVGLGAVFAGGALADPRAGRMLLVYGAGVAVFGTLWLCNVAFAEGAFLFAVVPFLHLVWSAQNLDRAGRPVVVQLLGVVLAALGWYLERRGE